MALLVLISFKFWSSETPAGHLILTPKCLFILEVLFEIFEIPYLKNCITYGMGA